MFERYYREILGHFSRKLGDRDAARDLVHDSYLRVISKLGAASVLGGDTRALLYKTGTHLLIDQARRRKVEQEVFRTLDVVQATVVPCQEQGASVAQEVARLLRALQRLPKKQREVFVLVRVYGHSHAEVSRHLGISIAAVEKHMYRAMIAWPVE